VDKKIIISSASIILLSLPAIIMAQTVQGIACAVMSTATSSFLIVALGFIIIMFVLAGFKYLTAQGEPNKVQEANKAIVWGLVGIVVIVLAWQAVKIVQNTIGYSVFQYCIYN